MNWPAITHRLSSTARNKCWFPSPKRARILHSTIQPRPALKPSSDALTFDFYPLRFQFCALDPIVFPATLSANMLRGAFGWALREAAPKAYADLFAPVHRAAVQQGTYPSGLANPPRPFVFRTRHLDGLTIEPGQLFTVSLNFFIPGTAYLPDLVTAFAEMGRSGFGAASSRATLLPQPPAPPLCSLPLAPAQYVQHIRVDFLTPTELKDDDHLVSTPAFDVVLRRARDRISTLRSFYGSGALRVDHGALSDRASAVQLTRCEVRHIEASRRSSRTGQIHPLGGFVGHAEYRGALSEFLPYLQIAAHTGIGRQTVWGKGEIAARPCPESNA